MSQSTEPMDLPYPANVHDAMEHLRTATVASATELAWMPAGEERSWQLRLFATILVKLPEDLKAAAIRLCPDVKDAEPIPDTQTCESEEELVSRLTEADIAMIDQVLLSNSTLAWQSTDRLIGYALADLKTRLPGAPMVLYVQRVVALARAGSLQHQGNLDFIRSGKVKLPAAGSAA